MARARIIKIQMYQNDTLADLPFEARYLFPGLWCLGDKSGRLEDRPKKIKGLLFPFDDIDADHLLTLLADAGFIKRYTIEGSNYIQVVKFTVHQRPHPKEPESVIPPENEAVENHEKTRQSRGKIRVGVKEGKEGRKEKKDKEQEDMSWAQPFETIFREAYRRYYPADYQDEVKDYVRLAHTRRKQNGAFTEENWRKAVENYLDTPQSSHTIADLASRFPVFLRGSLNEYGKPANGSNQRHTQQAQANGAAQPAQNHWHTTKRTIGRPPS